MLEDLSRTFTYLELASLDCGLADERIYHALCQAAQSERVFGTNARRKRMMSRLERAEKFVKYLENEEAREKVEFLLHDSDDIMPVVLKAFAEDKQRALESARKNIPTSEEIDEAPEIAN